MSVLFSFLLNLDDSLHMTPCIVYCNVLSHLNRKQMKDILSGGGRNVRMKNDTVMLNRG